MITIRIVNGSLTPFVLYLAASNMIMRFASADDARNYVAQCLQAGHTITEVEYAKLS